jgi:hypothetical protein
MFLRAGKRYEGDMERMKRECVAPRRMRIDRRGRASYSTLLTLDANPPITSPCPRSHVSQKTFPIAADWNWEHPLLITYLYSPLHQCPFLTTATYQYAMSLRNYRYNVTVRSYHEVVVLSACATITLHEATWTTFHASRVLLPQYCAHLNRTWDPGTPARHSD